MLLLLIALHLCDGDGPSAHEPMNADRLRAVVVEAHIGSAVTEPPSRARCLMTIPWGRASPTILPRGR